MASAIPVLNKRPTISPWLMVSYYNYDTWAVITRIGHQFLSQAQPMEETEFLSTSTDYVPALGDEQWVIRIAVLVLYFLRMGMWSWRVVFQD